METQLKFIGGILVLLALLHAGFPSHFNWPNDLRPLSPINRQMMYVHTLFIAFVVLLMGVLCLGFAADLVYTHLGHVVALGLGVFWLLRLLVQFFGYSAELWRGKHFETTIHVVFVLLWAYITTIFLLVAIG